MKWQQKLKDIINRCKELEEKAGTDHTLLKEYGRIAPHADMARNFLSLQEQVEALKDQENAEDEEMRALVVEELEELNKKLEASEKALAEVLLVKDEMDNKNAFVEVRSAAGGLEASLFCSDLIKMYSKYCERMDWKLSIEHTSRNDIGGYKECIAKIEGQKVYAHLRYESGVHRVQRVPSTESSGRIHTSAVTVAVLPMVDSQDFALQDKDLRVDVFRSSGAGGQHVNKTESAVRVTHIPTGISAVQQSERSQHRNKQKAMEVLRAKLHEIEFRKEQEKTAQERKSLVGSGDRSQKIRTYNFLQSRVTDHRIGWSSHNLEDFLNGGEELSTLLQALIKRERDED